MNLIDATKTGKRIRRKYWTKYQGEETWWDAEIGLPHLVPKDILADDWEVEPTPVPVTREQFDAAWHLARTTAPCTYDDLYQTLVKELGL